MMRYLFYKIQQKSRWWANDLLFGLGLGKHLLQPAPGAGRILAYHGVDTAGRKDLNMRFISATAFEAQIRYCKTHFHVLSLDDFFEKKFHPEKLNVAFTFDDGYLNNLTLVLPILEKYEVPATFFITGIANTDRPLLWPDCLDIASSLTSQPIEIQGIIFKKRGKEYYHPDGRKLKNVGTFSELPFIEAMTRKLLELTRFDSNPGLNEYWKMMSAAEIRQLAAHPLASIGVHGFYHTNLASIPFQDACNEILRCKNWLESVSNQKINAVAWPFGLYTPEIADYAKNIGLDRQYLLKFLFNENEDNPTARERFGTYPLLSLYNQMATVIKGHY